MNPGVLIALRVTGCVFRGKMGDSSPIRNSQPVTRNLGFITPTIIIPNFLKRHACF